ncbi:hypothetical protein H5P28_09575 [Ruficoccus amylovorans]|uniref:Uncharacterized protein n=1 Tax=Ruficoccus amylovorans TaxID=1804625 RepID=A0A842HFU3_9BACT|nr:hypothetical protein [Ruficoccus amylovorans]MBC2594506.1 hypothetical protein [Ruficoccus amylovorans]
MSLLLGLSACKPTEDGSTANDLASGDSGTAEGATASPVSQYIYVAGEGGFSRALFRDEPAPKGAVPVVLAWVSGPEDEAEVLSLLGGATGVRIMSGAFGLNRGDQNVLSNNMLLPLSERMAGGEVVSPQKGTADMPVHVRKIGDKGGEAYLDLTLADPDISQWDRNLFWQAGSEIRIVDEVAVRLGKRSAFIFATLVKGAGGITVSEENVGTVVETAGYTLIFQADVPLNVYAVASEVGENRTGMEGSATIFVECVEPVAGLKLVTRILPKLSVEQ